MIKRPVEIDPPGVTGCVLSEGRLSGPTQLIFLRRGPQDDKFSTSVIGQGAVDNIRDEPQILLLHEASYDREQNGIPHGFYPEGFEMEEAL